MFPQQRPHSQHSIPILLTGTGPTKHCHHSVSDSRTTSHANLLQRWKSASDLGALRSKTRNSPKQKATLPPNSGNAWLQVVPSRRACSRNGPVELSSNTVRPGPRGMWATRSIRQDRPGACHVEKRHRGHLYQTSKPHEQRSVAVAPHVMQMPIRRSYSAASDGLLWTGARGGWLHPPEHRTWLDGALKRAHQIVATSLNSPHGLRHAAA